MSSITRCFFPFLQLWGVGNPSFVIHFNYWIRQNFGTLWERKKKLLQAMNTLYKFLYMSLPAPIFDSLRTQIKQTNQLLQFVWIVSLSLVLMLETIPQNPLKHEFLLDKSNITWKQVIHLMKNQPSRYIFFLFFLHNIYKSNIPLKQRDFQI